jgi:hypothetical protein
MTDKFFFTPTELLAKYPTEKLTFQDIVKMGNEKNEKAKKLEI